MEWKKVYAGEKKGNCYNCGFLFDSAFQVGAIAKDSDNNTCQLCVECAETKCNPKKSELALIERLIELNEIYFWRIDFLQAEIRKNKIMIQKILTEKGLSEHRNHCELCGELLSNPETDPKNTAICKKCLKGQKGEN